MSIQKVDIFGKSSIIVLLKHPKGANNNIIVIVHMSLSFMQSSGKSTVNVFADRGIL